MKRSRPNLALMLREELPPEFEEQFDDLETQDITVVTHRISGGPYAGLELYLPAAVVLYVASNYFGGALKKAGEDHYLALKDVAKRLWKRASTLRIRTVGTPGKVSVSPKYSLAFAVTGEVPDGLNFKLVLKLNITEIEAYEAIPAFLDTVRAIVEDRLSEDEIEALLTYRPMGGVMLVTFDPETKRIVPVNGR